MDCACDKKIIEIPGVKENFSANGLFNKRLREAQRNIQDRLKDKELNNVFFLTLFEMPYIFCDGKVIAGFQSKHSKKPQKGKKINIGTLSNQPLNTLHLTERVIKTDRFKDDILPKVFLNGHASKQILDAGPGWYEVTYSEKTKLLNYLGLIPVAHDPTWGQYKESDKAKIKVYALKIELKNSDCHLYIIWSDGTSQEHSCLKERYNQLSSVLTQIFSKENTVSLLLPYYLDPSVKKDLKDTISFSSIEQKLLSRSYFDRNLDKITDEIYSMLELKPKSGKAKGFGCVFMRTKKPDANYFVIQVTPKMLEAMYKEIRDTIKKKDGIVFFKDILIKPYRGYYKHFKDASPEKLEDLAKFEDLVTEHAVSALINQLRDIDEKSIANDLSKVNIESILKYHKAFCDSRNGTYKWPDGCDPKKHKNIYFTCLAKSIIENTPLVSGVAYHVGKRGVPDLSIDWLQGNKIKHPFGLISYGEEGKYRYPEYFEKFADAKILKPEPEQLMLDVPVLHNGILLGVFIVYPSRVRKRNALTFFHKIYPNILKVIDNAKPDLMRALFLDVCANVNTILSGQNTDSFLPDPFIKETEGLIRYAHGMPLTYIIYFSDNLSGGNDKVIDDKLSEIIDDGKTKVINTLKEVIRTKKDSFDFCKDSKNGYLEVRKKLDRYENPYVIKHFVSYKYLKLEKWEFLILQLHSKHPDAFSPREETNALYLCQAIETGLRTLEKKYETIRHGSKAAMTAIESRNLSHNIGSHVLFRWLTELGEILKNKSDSEISGDNKLKCINQSKDLFQYIQHRMDFIAEISTSVPSSEMTMDFSSDVMVPFNNQKALLQNIGKSEGFDLEESIMLDPDPPHSDCKRVSVPNGIIGTHAIYSIIENFIRNAAKHCKGILFNEFEVKWEKLVQCCIESQGKNPIKEYIHEKTKDILDSKNNYGVFDKKKEFIQILNTIIKSDDFSRSALPRDIKLDGWACNLRKKVISSSCKEEYLMQLNRHIIEKTFSGCIKRAMKVEIELRVPDVAILQNNYSNHSNGKYTLDGNFLKINENGDTRLLTKAEQSEIKEKIINTDIERAERFFYKHENYIEFCIYDMREGSCNEEVFNQLKDYFVGANDFIKDGSIKPGGWGIKEMIMSANFMRKRPPEKILDRLHSKEPPLAEIICNYDQCDKSNCPSAEKYKNRLGIRFYLRRPKDMCIIGGEDIGNKIKGDKFEINYLNIDNVNVLDNLTDDIPHRLMLVPEKNNFDKYEYDNNPSIPMRIWTYKAGTCFDDKLYLNNYDDFIKNTLHNNRDLPAIFFGKSKMQKLNVSCNGNNKYKFRIDDKLNFENCKADNILLFIQHPEDENNIKTNEIEKIIENRVYFQPISGAYPFAAKLTSLPSDEMLERHFLLEIIESALTRVVIIDERVSDYSKIKVFNDKASVENILKSMKIFVLDIDKSNITKKSILEKFGKLNCNDYHFLVIHQGILDKVEKNGAGDAEKLMQSLKKKCRWRIIDSGRGVPPEIETHNDVRFIETSALLKMLETYDKHALVQTLFSLRRMPKTGGSNK